MIEYLDMNDPQFPEKLLEAIGIEPGQKLQIVTPQFDRIDNIVPEKVDSVDIEHLKTLSPEELKALGCGLWEENLWLLPYEWYGEIPEGVELESISGRIFSFQPGVTDDDMRYGLLAYGFRTN